MAIKYTGLSAPSHEIGSNKKSIGGSIGKSAAVGAAAGSVIPGVGTAVGAGVGALFGLGLNAYRGLAGRKQRKEAEGINPIRPEYEIPKSEMESLAMSQSLANQGRLAGQSQMEDQLGLAASQGYAGVQRAGRSAQSVMANMSSIAGNQNRSLNDMTIVAAQQKRQAEMQHMQGLSRMGQYEDQRWNINEQVPYLNQVDKKQALEAAAMANTSGALGGMSNLGFETANYFGQKRGLK